MAQSFLILLRQADILKVSHLIQHEYKSFFHCGIPLSLWYTSILQPILNHIIRKALLFSVVTAVNF